MCKMRSATRPSTWADRTSSTSWALLERGISPSRSSNANYQPDLRKNPTTLKESATKSTNSSTAKNQRATTIWWELWRQEHLSQRTSPQSGSAWSGAEPWATFQDPASTNCMKIDSDINTSSANALNILTLSGINRIYSKLLINHLIHRIW